MDLEISFAAFHRSSPADLNSFYINLPVGASALAILLVFFQTPELAKPTEASPREIFLQFDVGGTLIAVAAFVCYILTLEWGGVVMAWNTANIIGLFIGWILLSAAFCAVQYFQGDRALVPMRIIRQRNIAALAAFIFL